MTPAEFADAMRAAIAASPRDIEQQHIDTDNLMGQMLVDLGYGEGVDVLEGLTRWYA